jgi:pilus assembly protein CpaB
MTAQHEFGLAGRGARDPGLGRVRTRALIFTFFTLAAAFGAGYLVLRYLEIQRQAKKEAQATTPVVVMTEGVTVGTALDEKKVHAIPFPSANVPEGSFRSVKDVIGRVVKSSHVRGEPIVEARLAQRGASEGLSAAIPQDMRAMGVRVTDVTGVAGFIKPGDKVDVIVVIGPKGERGGEKAISKQVLQNIKVLAVGAEVVTKNNKPIDVKVVTLLVTPDMAEKLTLMTLNGEVQLVLRGQSDDGVVETPGITAPGLLVGAKDLQPDKPTPEPQPIAVAVQPKTRVVYRTVKLKTQPEAPRGTQVEVIRGNTSEKKTYDD